MHLIVRPATPADENDVVDLWRACGLVTIYNDPVADFRFACGGSCSDVLVGESNDGQINSSVMVGHDGHRGWLYYVASAPDARGRGLGRHMVHSAETWLKERRVVKLQLLVRKDNTAVLGFYEHLGLETTPRVVMTKWLTLPGNVD